MSDFFIWAHRGASAEAPENTLAAFRAAEAAGADGIELDIQLSRDGVPVVIHDDTVQRTTDGRGDVGGLRLRQLRQLDAGSWFSPAFSGEPVPTLEEVLAWAGGRVRLNLEVKAARAADALLELLPAFPEADVLISSFNLRLLEALRLRDERLPLALVTDTRFWRRLLKRAAALRAESLHPRHELVSRSLVQACHRGGLRIYPWTVNFPERSLKLSRLGVDGVFSDDPRRLDAALRGTGSGLRT